MGRSAKVAPATDADEGTLSVEFAQVIGQYVSKIAALESKVFELRLSNQALELELAQVKSRVLSADRQAPSVAEGVSLRESAQSTSSATPTPLQRADSIDHAVAAGIIAVGSRLSSNNYVEEMSAWARDSQLLLPKAVLL